MGFRVAVASSDGKFINQHFGRAQHFLIFEMDDKPNVGFQLLEVRQSTAICSFQQHDENRLQAVIAQLEDCKVVLASQIGHGAETVLAAKNIRAFAIANYITEALERIADLKHKNSTYFAV